MELAFDSKSLRTICESSAHAERVLGPEVAEALKHRLADLRATSSIRDLIAGSPRRLEPADSHLMCVDLSEGYRLVFTPNHPNNPTTQTGELDWARVSRIRILRIEKV